MLAWLLATLFCAAILTGRPFAGRFEFAATRQSSDNPGEFQQRPHGLHLFFTRWSSLLKPSPLTLFPGEANFANLGRPPAAGRRIWRRICCVLSLEEDGTERRMRNLIFAIATLMGVVMVAANAAHGF